MMRPALHHFPWSLTLPVLAYAFSTDASEIQGCSLPLGWPVWRINLDTSGFRDSLYLSARLIL